MCLATSNNLFVLSCPQFFFPRTRDLLVSQKTTQRHFFPTLHPLSPVIFATATVLAFVLLRNSSFNFHCYTQREATPIQKSGRKWRCDLSRLLARKITKGIHSCKPASLNHSIATFSLFLCRLASRSSTYSHSGFTVVPGIIAATPLNIRQQQSACGLSLHERFQRRSNYNNNINNNNSCITLYPAEKWEISRRCTLS